MNNSGTCLGAIFCCLVFTLAMALVEPASASETPHLMPLNPDVIEQAKARGEMIEPSRTEARFVSKDGRRINAPGPRQMLKSQQVRAIVLLVEFTDNPPGGPTTRYAEAVFDSMLFGQTYIRGGLDTTTDRTLKNYYDEISYGNVDVVTLNMTGSTGWVTAPNSYTYYCEADGTHDNGFGSYPRNVQRLVMDAVLAADPYVDFSQYAVGGEVENLFIVHAGSGAEWNGGPTLIWSHAWTINTSGVPDLYVDGVQVTNYSMEPECGGDTTGEGGTVTGPYLPAVGVYAHEFGHVLGLPDEYDYGYESSGTGRFSLMAGGSWNRFPNENECAGNSPAHPSAWGKVYLGFVTPVEVTGCLMGASIPPTEATNIDAIYKLTNPASGGQEYWLVENRQQIGFDEGFIRMTADAHGLLIYHVDEGVLANTFWRPNEAECVSGGVYLGQDNCDCSTAPIAPNDERWYGISIEQADGAYGLELGTSSGYWQDFFNDITGLTTFDETSIPNSTSYADCSTPVAVRNVIGNSGTMYADFFVGGVSCQVSPASLDFGTVTVGDHADDTYTITNTGSGTLTGTVGETCDHYSIVSGSGAYSLAAGEFREVTVRFEPTASGAHLCEIDSGNGCCPVVALTGVGEDPPVCDVSPLSLDFGTVTAGSSADDTFTITNIGSGTLAGTVGETCDHYSIVSGGGPYSLAAGEFVDVTVRFEPTVSGTHLCTIETGSGICGDVSCTGVGETPPVAAFSGDPLSGCAPLEVTFTDETTGEVTSWAWDFGDGNTSTDQNPVHTYTTSGDFDVELVATGPGGSDTMTADAYVSVTEGVTADFSPSVTTGTAPLSIDFTDLSTGSPTAWYWDFGDTGTDVVQNPTHVYTTAGTYTVMLVATGECGPDTLVQTDPILVDAPPAPVAAFSGDPLEGCAPLEAAFTDESTGDITSWSWDFGDGGTSTDQSPVYVFNTAGTFTVSLTVTGPGGSDPETKTDYATVDEPVVAAFSQSTDTGLSPLEVDFTDETTGDVTNWAWDFGDGDTSTEQNPSHTYTTVDTFTVTLIAGNSCSSDTLVFVDAVKVTAISGVGDVVPTRYVLEQNVPNPFNPMTTIYFELPEPATVSLRVYDISGRLVRSLLEGSALGAGRQDVVWNGKDDGGQQVATGVYFYHLNAGSFNETRRMVLVK